ncbi:MAG: radical SAM protein [Lachnospiraceae bacterium]|nr:radical SAM protein [Lachnospiraceae bacterium]MDY5521450.1 radical SAM protein [Agathobacter sp.]
METEEREKQFDAYRGEGWEEEYAAYRKAWTKNAKEQHVAEWPLLVDIETSSVCNLNCPMCYTITNEFKEKVHAKLMDDTLFHKIIDEIGGNVPAIRLSLRGEPTIHPHLLEYIKYAKQKGIKEVSFLSNGSRFTDDFIRELIQAEVDWITVSIDGTGEEYNRIRKPLRFEETYHRIKRFNEIKKEMGVHKPVIKIQSIWPALKNNVEEYYNMFEPITDSIAFNPLIDYLDNDVDIVYDEDFSCPQLYQRIIIAADGQVLMCSNDEENMNVIGNANIENIYDIWHGEKLHKIREQHKNPCGFKDIPVCRKCYLPRKTEENEEACINGRRIVIKNYIGRSQKIGE